MRSCTKDKENMRLYQMSKEMGVLSKKAEQISLGAQGWLASQQGQHSCVCLLCLFPSQYMGKICLNFLKLSLCKSSMQNSMMKI